MEPLAPHAPLDHLLLELPVDPISVGRGRRAATQFAEECGCSEATLWGVRLAVSEAVTNVVLHAHDFDDERDALSLELLAEHDAQSVSVTVSDSGHGMRPHTDSPGAGVGMALMRRACDELALGTSASGGVAVRMTFLCTRPLGSAPAAGAPLL